MSLILTGVTEIINKYNLKVFILFKTNSMVHVPEFLLYLDLAFAA